MHTGGNTLDKSKYLLDSFERACRDNWIEVYYQPIVRATNGRVCGEEALVRWDDPIMGVLNPGEFVPILEAVNLIHILDLYVLDKVLEKIRRQEERGLFVVPNSVNLSQIDFFSCNIVDEVNRRVQEAGVSPEHIAIDVAESAVSRNNEYVIAQLEHFQQLGYKVWMDDFGSGDSSPLLLQRIHFDMLKINTTIVNQLLLKESARIIVTELVRMAMALGIEITAEGVEYEEQAEFLKEIGCAKFQGFLYCKPISAEQIFARYTQGTQIGFENPLEADYYAMIGRMSLYDLSFANEEGDKLNGYFDTLPMAVLQTNDEKVEILRCNKNFRVFMESNFTEEQRKSDYYFAGKEECVGYYAMNAVRVCGKEGKRVIIDERTKSGKTVQLLLHRIAVNPLSGVAAVAMVILSVTERPVAADDLTYNYIARALAEDYVKLYYVNLDTDDFVEYSSDGRNRDVSVDEMGEDFFGKINQHDYNQVYKEDKAKFKSSFTKANIRENLDKYGSYTLTYRTIINMEPTYVNLKAVRVRTDNNHIIIGISNVDAQTRRQEAMERIREERATYSRISALSGDFISIYTVNPETDQYMIYKTSQAYQNHTFADEGDDFFKDIIDYAKDIVFIEDIAEFKKSFTKENILKQIKENGMFILNSRLCINDEPIYVAIKCALVEEMDGPQLIVGLINVDREFKKEIEYAASLSEAQDKAVRDELTGVKNKNAYTNMEKELNKKLKAKDVNDFAIVVFDLNGLKEINDTKGHHVGDMFIKSGCHIICNAFGHSPVYRVGGDEFVAIAQGKDYEKLESLLDKIDKINQENKKKGEVTIAYGACKNAGKTLVNEIFDQADANMYLHKKRMKSGNIR